MFYRQIGQYNEFYFICDTESDIEDLPTAEHKVDGYTTPSPGAVAFVIEGSNGYSTCFMYGNDDAWHEIK